MESTAQERIERTRAQAVGEVGDRAQLERGEQIASVSQAASLGAGAAIAVGTGGVLGLAVFGAGLAGGYLGANLAEKIGAAEFVAGRLEAFGMQRIGQGGPHPARLHDQVAHSHAAAGFLASIIAGAIAAVAVGALIIATGGAAAVVLIGAAAAGGLAGGFVGSALAGAAASLGTRTGPIITGSPDVFIEGLPAARMTDTAACSRESTPQPIIEGSATIFVNDLPMARIGDLLLCGAVVDQGALSVFADESKTRCADPAPEIPVALRVLADVVGVVPWGAAAGRLASRTRSARVEGRPQAKLVCKKDPVEVASGEFMEWRTDVAIPGVLPLELRRHYASRREARGRESFFGPRWVDSWSVSLERRGGPGEGASLVYHDDEGVSLSFDTPQDVLDAEHLMAPQLLLRGTRDAPVLHDRESGLRRHFEWCGSVARLIAFSDASGNRIDFVYGGAQRPPERQPDRDDRSHDGPLTGLRHSDGWRLELRWRDGSLHRIELHEPDRRPVELVRYGHDARGRLVRCASEASGRITYGYDSDHRITDWGDDTATRVRVNYDPSGRVADVRTPGHLHSGRFEYDDEARRTRVWDVAPEGEDPAPRCTTYHYNADRLVTRVEDPLGHTTATEWDRYQRVQSRTDELGRVTRYRHDDAGRLLVVIDPAGRRSDLHYDDEGRLTSIEDARGTSRIAYDEAGRIVTQTGTDGRSLHSDHDARGRLLRERADDGATVQHHYDEQHRPCGRTAPNGAHTAWRQDRLGRVDWQTDALGATTTYDYDDHDHDEPREVDEPPRLQGHVQPRRIVAADGGTVTQRCNAEGLLAEQTDAAGHTQRWHWGAFDLLEGCTDALGHTTRYRYGSEARLAELTNALGQRWRWHYDAAGRLVEEIDYAGRRTRWERDAAGRPATQIKPDGRRLRYTWDESDRLRAIDGSETRLAYAYDAQDRLVQARVWRLEPGLTLLQSELSLHYDKAGRLSEETHRSEGGPLRRIGYRYDEAGRLVARDGPLGQTRYGHDTLGLLRELHTEHGAVHIARNLLGQETERASQPGSPVQPGGPGQPAQPHFRLHQHYDKLGRLTHQRTPATTLPTRAVERRYEWQHERLVGITDTRFGSVRWTLDAREQITEAAYGRSQAADESSLLSLGAGAHRSVALERFRYDAVGNIAAQSEGGATVPQRYERDTVSESGTSRYSWDACGRMASRTSVRNGFRPKTWHYRWDDFDRLVGVITPDDQRWDYAYDAFNRRRIKRRASALPRRPEPAARPAKHLSEAEYLWDGATLAAQWKRYADGRSEAPAGAGPGAGDCQEWHFEPGSFKPLALLQQRGDEPARLMHVVGDLNGAPRELLGNDGELLWAAQLDTWGHLAHSHVQDRDRAYASGFGGGYRHAANDPAVEVDLRFANQWDDAESGLVYNLNRYYDPDIGQYASVDPLGPTGSSRTHGYVHNPVTWTDPLGLIPCPELYGRYKAYRDKGLTAAEAHRAAKGNFATQDKLATHFKKHGAEFGAKSEGEYLQVGRDIIRSGSKVHYPYKHEMRTGYVQFMGNSSKGGAKFGFVGTNADGAITTIHTESGRSFWKMLNGDSAIKIISPMP